MGSRNRRDDSRKESRVQEQLPFRALIVLPSSDFAGMSCRRSRLARLDFLSILPSLCSFPLLRRLK
jgi:hypothetical protein